MENREKAVERLSLLLKQRGYRYFNFRNGYSGSDFKSGITAYLEDGERMGDGPEFPILATTGLGAEHCGQPQVYSTFIINEDPLDGLRIDAVDSALHDGHEGGIRHRDYLKLNSPDEIPSLEDLRTQVESKGKVVYERNKLAWKMPRTDKGETSGKLRYKRKKGRGI